MPPSGSGQAHRACAHEQLYLDVSPHASHAKFKRPTQKQRISAASSDGKASARWNLLTKKSHFEDPMTFPGPLVLPEDDLAEDPEYPPQDFPEWRDDEERNPVTGNRNAIYVARSPKITKEMAKMAAWSHHAEHAAKTPSRYWDPSIEEVAEYLSAFYYGMQVKVLDQEFSWHAWDEPVSKKSKKKPQRYVGAVLQDPDDERRIGLATPQQGLFGVRCRASPDGVAPMQVNLNDVLDALLEAVPGDAHSIVMLLDQDMYEGDGDLFTAGRAYGGSRIAAVSRYRDHHSIAPADDEGHGWPSSHCATYVDGLCSSHALRPAAKRAKVMPADRQVVGGGGALHVAIEAAAATRSEDADNPRRGRAAQWLARIAQTVAHELGHCLGLDHCVYFACVMQGCSSQDEALRQPPYLCPVCLQKVATAIGEGVVEGWAAGGEGGRAARDGYVRERYEALRRVCEKWDEPGLSRYFTGYKAWLDEVLKDYEA